MFSPNYNQEFRMNGTARIRISRPLIVTLVVLLFLAVSMWCPSRSLAQEEGVAEPEIEGEPEEEEKESGFHHLSVFLGATDRQDGEPEFTMGIDYVYRLAPIVGIGALYDNPRADFRDAIIAAGFTLYPVAEFYVLAAPGFEFQEGHDTEILFRLGLGYNVFIGKSQFTIAPALNFDYVSDEVVYVYGLNFGIELGK
jgi:hypothetical protein